VSPAYPTGLFPPIYEDNHLLVLNKPAGVLVQGDHTGDTTLLDLGKSYIKDKYNKPGNVYLGLVHRLDRPASGIVVLARTSKAASRLSEQIRGHQFHKKYLATVSGHPPSEAEWRDTLVREEQHSRVAGNGESGKEAVLRFQARSHTASNTRVEIELITGRHHQIRVQFSSRGFPLVGDFRYGSTTTFGDRAIALHAVEVEFAHPTTKETLRFRCEPDW
jgi:RluA family pseudouridine synthase